jgi:hypothetical protein
MARLTPWAWIPLLIGAAFVARPARVGATSKVKIIAVGDAAPGGGIFAGPGFSSAPVTAGSGWMAFRGETTGGNTTETMVVAHMTTPRTMAQVASLGQVAPANAPYTNCAGKLKQFLGPPAVNANGDVAFMALVEPPPNPNPSATSGLGPTPAGIFLFHAGQLQAIACSGQALPGGILDLSAVVDPLADDTSNFAERAPTVNAAGDVAFLTGYATANGFPTGGAIILAHAGTYTEMARLNGPFDGGTFLSMGPPVMNNGGLIVFHGLVQTTDPSESNGLIDGIFAAGANGVSVLVKDGIAPMPANQPLLEFEDQVAVNDAGDVAFLAGPLFDLSPDAALNDTGNPGVLVLHAGVVTLAAYPGEKVGNDRITGPTLGPSGGSALAGPSIAPDGTLVCYVSLNDGNSEAMLRFDGTTLLPLAYTGGAGANTSPSGGTFSGAESGPSVDAVGGVAFLVRVAGGASIEAIIYRAASGTESPIVLGQAAPKQSDGFFGGRPFEQVHLNDQDDVVFRAFVARGPSSLGIFRARDGDVSAVVRVGDPAPLDGGPAFVDLIGEPGLNQMGAIAFQGQVGGKGRGLFVADANGLRKVVLRGDPAPGFPGTQFESVGVPEINDAGAVAFRGTTANRDPLTGLSTKEEGIFLADASGIHALVYLDDPSPVGIPYFTLRDPLVTDAPNVVFRAPLGATEADSSAIIVSDASGTRALATQLESLGNGIAITGISSDPDVSGDGHVAVLTTRGASATPGGPPTRDLGPAIMAGDVNSLALVIARNMPGPAGGTFNNLGPPAVNDKGHVAFSGSFNLLTGGTGGVFLEGDAGLVPYVLHDELAPIGSGLSTIGSHIVLNAGDDLAFTAVTGGTARNAIFLATPTTLTPQQLLLRLTTVKGKAKDRLSMRAVLTPGHISNGVHPAKEALIVSLSDTTGSVWSATVPAKGLKGGGRTFSFTPKPKSDLGKKLRSVRVALAKNRTVRVSAVSAPVDLTQSGLRPLKPPFTMSVEVGDDGGRAVVPCTLGDRGARCK